MKHRYTAVPLDLLLVITFVDLLSLSSTGRFFAYNFRVGNLVESLFESTWSDGVIILVELELELESCELALSVGRRYAAET